MDSLNMNTFAKSLPPQNIVKAEQDLMDKFKASAMSITTLYRSALATSKQHYNAGYAAALEDLLSVLQQGVSVGGGDGLTIGRIMDWIDARREAMKEREDDEDEDEYKDRESRGKASSLMPNAVPPCGNGVNDARDKATEKDNVKPNVEQGKQSRPSASLPTPRSPEVHAQALATSRPRAAMPLPSSPSPPPTKTHTRSRPRSHNQKDVGTPLLQSHPEPLGDATTNINFNAPLFPYPVPPSADNPSSLSRVPLQSVLGAKRRHAAMLEIPTTPVSFGPFESSLVFGGANFMANEGIPSPANSAASGRRRVRHQRSGTLNSITNSGSRSEMQTSDAMEVEDENGRERKRVARR